jgi:hypothetical protein
LNRNGFHLWRTRITGEWNGEDFSKSIVLLKVLPTSLDPSLHLACEIPVELLDCLRLPSDVLPDQVQVLVERLLDRLEILIQRHFKKHFNRATFDDAVGKNRAEGRGS